jgi:N-acylneuraminate cytidylyltransferase
MQFGFLLLLQPTTPGRLPEDVSRAVVILNADPGAVGVISVSEPPFHPRWSCVKNVADTLKSLFSESPQYARRQDMPVVFLINGLLYLWRRDHVLNAAAPLYDTAPHRMLVVPEIRGGDVDTA